MLSALFRVYLFLLFMALAVDAVPTFQLNQKSSSVSKAPVTSDSDAVLKVIQSAEFTADRLTPQADIQMTASSNAEADYTLKVDVDAKQQEIIGFGGAFTDSTAFTFMQLPDDKQEELLEAYFGESGNRYTLCRLTIGSSDFSVEHYNYANTTDDWDH